MDLDQSYKYCPRCSFRLVKSDDYLKCNECELNFYLDSKPAVAAVIKYKDKYLFTKRAIDPEKGKYDLAGGFLNRKESFEDAIRREVMEELNIEISNIKYLTSRHDKYLYQNINYDVIVAYFTCEIKDISKIKPMDDISGFELLKLDNLPMDEVAFTSTKKVLRELTATIY